MKRVVLKLMFLLSLLSGVFPLVLVYAQAFNSQSDIRILSSSSFLDTKSNEVYDFENPKDMKTFMESMFPKSNFRSIKRSNGCLPGSPGYLNCQKNPIVSSYSVFKYSYNSYVSGGNLVETVRVPGIVSISHSYGASVEGLASKLSMLSNHYLIMVL